MRFLSALGLALILSGLVVVAIGVDRLMGQENELHSNVVQALEESKNSGISSPLRNAPDATDTIADDNFDYSIDGTIAIKSENFEALLLPGVSDEELDIGVGHYPGTAYPGQAGNFAVAVHRPLVARIDTMGPGDEITVTNNGIKYTYEWRESFVVAPDRVDVLDSMEGKWLTLTTCHPRYSNAERLIVRAELTRVG